MAAGIRWWVNERLWGTRVILAKGTEKQGRTRHGNRLKVQVDFLVLFQQMHVGTELWPGSKVVFFVINSSSSNYFPAVSISRTAEPSLNI